MGSPALVSYASNLERSNTRKAADMRIGVIGVGRIGSYHTGILEGIDDVDSIVVTDADPDLAARVAAERGVEAAPSVDALLAGVHAVVIAAATSAHAELIERAMSAAVPAFCEKPISLDLESTRRVVDIVEKAEVPLQMGFQRRFDPGYRAAAAMVRDGSLGQIYVVRMAGHDPAPPHEAYIPHSGGIFRDFSVHDFDALRFVTGHEVEEVYADGSVIAFPVFEKYGDVDTAVATLRLDDGSLGILSVARHDPLGYDIRMEVFGSKDSIAVGWDDHIPLHSVEPGVPPPPGAAYENFQQRFRPAYEAELAAFLDVARGRRENPCTAADALEALRVAVAADMARAQHRPVRLAEVT